MLARKHPLRRELRKPVYKQPRKDKQNLYRQPSRNRVTRVAWVRRHSKHACRNHVELKRAPKKARPFVRRVVVRTTRPTVPKPLQRALCLRRQPLVAVRPRKVPKPLQHLAAVNAVRVRPVLCAPRLPWARLRVKLAQAWPSPI